MLVRIAAVELPGIIPDDEREFHEPYWPAPYYYVPPRHPPHRESARRKALFDKARMTLRTLAAIAGHPTKHIGTDYRPEPGGPAMGLFVCIGDKMITWSPRGGFCVEDAPELPF